MNDDRVTQETRLNPRPRHDPPSNADYAPFDLVAFQDDCSFELDDEEEDYDPELESASTLLWLRYTPLTIIN